MDSRTDARSAWAVYAALLFGTFITIEAAAFQAPALPSVTRHFGIPVNMAALVLILYSLALTVFAPIMGRLGDQHGRKKVITIGMLVFAVSEFAAAWAPNFAFFLGARFAYRVGLDVGADARRIWGASTGRPSGLQVGAELRHFASGEISLRMAT